MFRGVWHQCGDKSQRLVEEQLRDHHIGGGVILSPRDLSRARALDYAASYRGLGAQILLDHQFHVPGFTNRTMDSYPISALRGGISSLNRISDVELNEFANHLRVDHQELHASALLAPGVVYEAGRPDIIQLNSRLFGAAKRVGDDLHIPTYATVVLGRSVVTADQTISAILSAVTALDSNGWYFAFEFADERLPSDRESVRRCCAAGLTLACTGKPVLHAYAGPLGILSFGFGATGIGIGHAQNTWRFTRDRWQPPNAQGGGGDAPPRFFSTTLWGTIIYPDEMVGLPAGIRNEVNTASPFSTAVTAGLGWDRWRANKHLVYSLGATFAPMVAETNARRNAQNAVDRLRHATVLHQSIQANGVFLGDNPSAYHLNWRLALEDVLRDRHTDYDYLELLT